MEEKKYRNKGGRPKKKDLRDRRVEIRLTQEEHQILSKKAIRLNRSMAELLRDGALNVKVLEKQEPKELIDVQRELSKIGTNVNQVARKLNQNVQTSDYFLKKEVQDIKNKLADIFDKLS
jgi:hypothetical protein